ncbi:MAG TPA: 6,7-dimethyl-8-ribityllumazine synthase [Gaiellaceae bacterium]
MSDRWTSDPGLSGSEPLSPAEELDELDLDDLEDEVADHPAEERVVAHEEEREPGEAEQHAAGELDVPRDVNVLEGTPDGSRRGVAIVASRYNGEITNKLLNSALEELYEAGVRREAITVMPVPGAFELPLAAMALAKTRRYSCVVALGCIVRGETPHFDFIASEAASGLQLAALETGVPVAFGVLTVDVVEQAEARVSKGAEAVRTALEMADAFAQLRASARG